MACSGVFSVGAKQATGVGFGLGEAGFVVVGVLAIFDTASTARGVATVAGFEFLDFAVGVGDAEHGLLAGGFDFEGF